MRKISFVAEIDNKKAAKQLSQLEAKIAKTTAQLNSATEKRSGIEAQMEAAGQKADETRAKVKALKAELATATANVENSKIGGTPTLETYKAQDIQSRIQAQLTQQEGILKSQIKNVDTLGRQYAKADASVQKITGTLEQQQTTAGKLMQQLGSTFDPAKLKAAGQSIKSHLAGGFKTVLKYVLGIRSLYILIRMMRSAVTEGIKEMTKYDSGVNKTVSNLKNSLTGLKASLAAASLAFTLSISISYGHSAESTSTRTSPSSILIIPSDTMASCHSPSSVWNLSLPGTIATTTF